MPDHSSSIWKMGYMNLVRQRPEKQASAIPYGHPFFGAVLSRISQLARDQYFPTAVPLARESCTRLRSPCSFPESPPSCQKAPAERGIEQCGKHARRFLCKQSHLPCKNQAIHEVITPFASSSRLLRNHHAFLVTIILSHETIPPFPQHRFASLRWARITQSKGA